MPSAGSESEPDSGSQDPADLIRSAIKELHESLIRSVALLVARTHRSLRWPDVLEKASEILSEAVEQALKHADLFDPSRSAAAWIRGISARLLLSRTRTEARGRRCISAAALGNEAWSAALEQLLTGSAESAVAARLDLEQALGRLSPEERRAIELRYYRGLDGAALAAALNVPSAGAARVRVCRALQSLRTQFSSAHQEMPS
jgi:RNA polymerase sigma factor (sigma-70 family)